MEIMKKLNAKRVAEKIGKAHSYIYQIKKGQYKCPVMLAGTIHQAAKAIAREMGLPPESLIGWRLQDLRPDVIQMVNRCLYSEDQFAPWY